EIEKDPFRILDLMTTHVESFKSTTNTSSTSPLQVDALNLVNEFWKFIYSASLWEPSRSLIRRENFKRSCTRSNHDGDKTIQRDLIFKDVMTLDTQKVEIEAARVNKVEIPNLSRPHNKIQKSSVLKMDKASSDP
ncbi:unnamed protein product, partial [Sphenostylis stenocarpa]